MFSGKKEITEITNIDQLNQALKEMALCEHKRDEVTAKLNQKANEILAEIDAKAAPFQVRYAELEEMAKAYCEEFTEHVFGEKKSRKLQFGEVKYTESIGTVLDADPERPASIDILLDLPKKQREKFVKTEYKPIKPNLKKLDKTELEQYNIKLEKKKNFHAEPFKLVVA